MEKNKKVLKFYPRLKPDEATERINKIAQDSNNVYLTEHFLERCEERGFLTIDLYKILKEGNVYQEPTKGKKGDWSYMIELRMRGHRDAGAATIILNDNTILVKNIQWMDLT